jgi:molybdate transport system ATP-binding protein
VLHVDLAGKIGPLALHAAFDTSRGTLVLTGPNGAGKTSLLLMILGVLRAERGRVTLEQKLLFDSATGVDVAVEQRAIGYVPQSYGLFPHLTARQNVEFALSCQGSKLGRGERRDKAKSLLAELGIAALESQRPAALSAGERQRVALARAIACKPQALLLDEPFAALDIGTRRQVRLFLRDYLERLAIPTLVVTHDAADARAVGRHVVVIEAGSVVQEGSWEELSSSPVSPFVRELTM